MLGLQYETRYYIVPLRADDISVAMAGVGDVSEALRQQLSRRHLNPDSRWLESFLATARQSTPIPALAKTAEYRLLQSDITETFASDNSCSLPAAAANAEIKDQALRHPIVVQVLDIEDIGRSRWSQVELIEQQERGEMTRGREIIRVVPDSEDRGPPSPEPSRGPHKLLVQDVKGTKIYAFELSPIPGVGLNLSIGAKLLVKDAHIARGLILLERDSVEVLGGTVKTWAEQWASERKQALKSRITDSVGNS